ncbi:MAG: hypothetical protein WCD38_08555 [Candidatus Tumulicola sp.]
MQALVVAACLALLPGPAARVLHYSYTYETGMSASTEKAYGLDKMDPGSGGTFMFHNVNQHYLAPSFDASQSRRGTLTVEVVREEADGGLVLRVREAAPGAAPSGSAPGATCVAFGDTTVICDPTQSVSPEAVALLGLLGKNFVDASQLDASRHWHVVASGSYGGSADFTVVRSDAEILTISERGVRAKAGSSEKTDVSAAILYDTTRSLPVSVDESVRERVARGDVVSETRSSHVTLTLEPR